MKKLMFVVLALSLMSAVLGGCKAEGEIEDSYSAGVAR